METWNSLVEKFDLLLTKIKLDSTMTIAGRQISPTVMGFALIAVCIPIWGYLEYEGKNKFIGALVVILMAWSVAQLSALGFGDGVGEKPGGASADKPSAIDQPVADMGNPPDPRQRLAHLAFAGVVVALAVIYLLRNVDRFEELNGEFRYRELVAMVEPVQDTIEIALRSGSVVDIEFLGSGESGLPDEVLVSENAHGLSVINGQIIATWMNDESDLDGVTYVRTPKFEDGEIEWATTGTCGKKKAC